MLILLLLGSMSDITTVGAVSHSLTPTHVAMMHWLVQEGLRFEVVDYGQLGNVSSDQQSAPATPMECCEGDDDDV